MPVGSVRCHFAITRQHSDYSTSPNGQSVHSPFVARA